MRLSPLCLLLLASATGCRGGDVVRVFDGVERHGRFINDWAYASYARGVEWEARGQPEDALRFYDEALEQDGRSVEIWSRIGELRCRLDRPDADDAFDEAMTLDAHYEPLWRARAMCAVHRGDHESALAHAGRAVELDPSRDETVILFAQMLAKAGRADDAERWLRSLAVRSPRSSVVWQAVAAFARGRAPALFALAEARVAESHPSIAGPAPAPTPKLLRPWQLVDEALVAGSLDIARERLRTRHLDVRRLAARAIVVGRPELAVEEASLRVGADPGDGDARVALALAADLTGEAARAGDVLAAFPADAALSAMGRAMLAELLVRREGVDAAALWLGTTVSELDGEGAPRARLVRAINSDEGS